MHFGENVSYYRKQLGLTQDELAEKMFVSRQTISRWETDAVLPDVETVIRLCELFQCSMDILVRGYAEEGTEEPEAEKKEAETSDDKPEKTANEEKPTPKKKRFDPSVINEIFCPVVMLLALLLFLTLGFYTGTWHWFIFIIAVLLCGISSVITEELSR